VNTGAGIFEEGPLHSPDDALPVDCYRVKAFYAERADGMRTVEMATCDQGKWWGPYHKAEAPVAWRQVRDRRMTVGDRQGEA
jgi:hypothetical protein